MLGFGKDHNGNVEERAFHRARKCRSATEGFARVAAAIQELSWVALPDNSSPYKLPPITLRYLTPTDAGLKMISEVPLGSAQCEFESAAFWAVCRND